MIETRNDLQAVLAILASSPLVTFSTGYTDRSDIVRDDGVIVHKAPSSVVQRLVKECVLVCMMDQGLFVPVKR